jgi:hypothetical protein
MRVTFLLEENDLWDIVKDVVTRSIDLQQLVAHNKTKVKAKHTIFGCHKGSSDPSCVREEDNK